MPILLLLFLASCSNTPPVKPPVVASTAEPLPMTSTSEPAFQEPPAPVLPEASAPAPVRPPTAVSTETPAAKTNETVHPVEKTAAKPVSTPAPTVATPQTPPTVAAKPPVSPGNPPAQPPVTTPAEQMIPAGMIDFRNTPLEQVLQVYAELVNRTLLRPSSLPTPQVTLKTQTQLTKSEAIQALDAVLGLNGVTMINVGDKFVKAVAQPQALQEGGAPDTRKAEQLPDFGPFVTHVVQLKYVKPSEILPALQPFAKMNSILPIDSSGILVIRDYTENVKRMLEMIDRIDVTVPSEFVSEVIPIRYALAEDISDALNSLGAGGGGGGGTIGRSGSRGTTGSTARPGVGSTGAFNRGGIGGTTSPYGGLSTPGSPTAPGGAVGGSSFSDRLQQIIRKASATGDLQLFGQMKIIADTRSNSLLIFASKQDMETMKEIVSKLDVVLAQVLIETLIMDVTIGDNWSLGVSAAQRPKEINTRPDITTAGGINNSQKFFDFVSSVASNSVTSDSLPSGLSYFGKINETWDIAVQAAASDNRVKVVQRPRIQTSHATPASLFIGSTVPYVTSTYYGGGYGGGPSSSYQQLKVGIGLNVTPFINQDGLVVMKIDETIDELDGSTPITGVGNVPNTKSSALSAEIAVRDGETIVLGGIIRNSDDKSNSGVPYLKDIPLLGALFRSSSSTKKRQESIVLMRPTVLRTPELAAQQVTEERKHMPGVSEAASDVQRYEREA
ncbi:MAG: secretin N-terminal domain-containing protein [Verrucomicrobiota bacterium]